MGLPKRKQDAILNYFAPIVFNMGYFLLSVEIKGAVHKRLCMFVEDRNGNITIDQLSNLSRYLRDALSIKFPETDNWELEVSSPGLERELKTERERRFYIGKMVRLVLHNGSVLESILLDTSANHVVINKNCADLTMDLKNIARIHLLPPKRG